MNKSSKRYKNLTTSIKDKKLESVEKIIDVTKSMANTKFIESIDLSFKLNLKKVKSTESALRTVIELPKWKFLKKNSPLSSY